MKRKISMMFLALFLLFAIGMIANAATVKMNKTSATIQIGETVQLQVLVDGTVGKGVWGSADSSVATVSSTGLVTGKAAGSSVISVTVNGSTAECVVSVVKKSTQNNARYNVLILDTSRSMKGTPLKRVKTAAKRFSKTILGSEGNNYLAVVTLNSSPKIVCSFTNDLNTLNKAITKLKASGETNMNKALQLAGQLLDAQPSGSGIMKNVILCSDGLPKSGAKSASGRYSSADHKRYKLANAVYKTDVSLKNKDYFVYALGFFHNSKGKDLSFGKQLMKDLASKDKYFIVTESKDVDDVFQNIAADINNITINQTELTLYAGETYTLQIQVNGKNTKATWKSSAKKIAGVSSFGKVTAKKTGTATITATVNGQNVTCKVNVKKPTISLDKTNVTLMVGERVKLNATVTGPQSSVKWKSKKAKIATVDEAGNVTAVAAGTVKIVAAINGASKKCTVVVKERPQGYIYTVDDLKRVADKLDGTYYLMNDLDLGSEKWIPIGTDAAPFTGKFYGNGHTISNLNIETAASNQGLFGVTDGAQIQELAVDGAVKGGAYAAGIVGHMTKDSTMSHCINYASVTGAAQVGGVVGRVSDSTMDHCLNYGNVTTSGRGCGGITADIFPKGTVTACVNMADVSGGSDITGGIVGGSTSGTINGCYNAGNVTGRSRKGAIAGDNAGYAGSRSNNHFLKTSEINAGYSPIGTGSGTFDSLQAAGLQGAIAEIKAKF